MNDKLSIFTWMHHSQWVSEGLFSHPNYLVAQCWVCVGVFFPDSITPGGPKLLFTKVFPLGGWVTHKGTPCHHTMTIIDVVHLFIIAAYPLPKLLIIFTLPMLSHLIKGLCSNSMFVPLHTDDWNEPMILPFCILYFA